MNLAATPKEIANIKAKGMDFEAFQRLRKYHHIQAYRTYHKSRLLNNKQ